MREILIKKMTERRISGNRTAEDVAREYYARQAENPDDDTSNPQPANPQPSIAQPAVQFNLQNVLYQIDKPTILRATTPDYRKFLRDSGYGDLDSCSHLGVAKGILKYNQDVRQTAQRAGLALNGNDGDYVIDISHPNARKLVEALGYKVLTTALMYKLFIPYIKDLAQSGNAEAQATLNEMTDTSAGKAEWLEDLVKDKKKVLIGTKEKKLTLPDKDGRFDRADINEFGYPTKVKDSGEFYYWYPKDNERAVIRGGVSELGLGLGGEPSLVGGGLGVRPAKIF